MDYELIRKEFPEENLPELSSLESKKEFEFSLKAIKGQEFSTPYVCH